MTARITPRERPILFSGEMVRQILAGEKTQTRRPIGLSELRPSTTPGYDWTWRGMAPVRSIAQQRRYPDGCWQDVSGERLLSLCPYGEPGDRLWVRETWAVRYQLDDLPAGEVRRHAPGLWLRADHPERPYRPGRGKWRPSVHMPRWASRLTLEVTGVRVERVQDISIKDAEAEGFSFDTMKGQPFDVIDPDGTKRRGEFAWAAPDYAFGCAWERAYPGSWQRNDWVWVVEFRRVEADR